MEKRMNGTLVSEVLYDELRFFLELKGDKPLQLVDISVGNDFGGEMYANMKKKKLEKMVGYLVESRHFDSISYDDLVSEIESINNDNKINGVMLQLPLSKELNDHERKILDHIDWRKDVDGLTTSSIGRLVVGEVSLEPCTPKGIITLLKVYGVDIVGKNVVIVNRSNIVGKPLEQLFLRENATTTICHSKTKNLSEVCSCADIVVAAMNKQEMVDSSYVKDGAIVIDVGVHRNSEGKTVGDVKFDDVYDKSSLITPPTGGVGPMTICMLAYNTAKAKYGNEVDIVLEKAIEKAKVLVK